MKNLYNYLLVLLAVSLATSCDPMKEIYDELDQQQTTVQKETEYTLTASDYETLASKYVDLKMAGFSGDKEAKKELQNKLKKDAGTLTSKHAFNNKATANLLVPYLLESLLPEWGKGSSAMVTYNDQLRWTKQYADARYPEYLTMKKKDWEEIGISNITNLRKDDQKKLLAYVKEKFPDANSVLVVGTYDKDKKNYFVVNGKMAYYKDYYVLQYEDYKSFDMNYPNFGSSDPVDKYVCTILNNKFPAAEEGSTKVVVWDVYSNKKNQARLYDYIMKDGVWIPNSYIVSTTTQFVHVGEKWVFDPTIKFEMEESDFVTLHSWVKQNKPNYISQKYPTNEEYWFGGSGYYKNFNLDGGATVGDRPEEAGLEGNALREAKYERLKEAFKIVLKDRYPTNPAQVDGIDQLYIITVELRIDRANAKYSYTFKGLGNGEFEYVEGPVAL